VCMTEPHFQRLAKSGGYSQRGLRERMGIHRILKARPLAQIFSGVCRVPRE
jgi:hypothetical protein